MSSQARTIVVSPFSLRIEPGAVSAFERLSRRERDRLYDLSQTPGEALTWLNGDSVEARHDLWVLHQWSEALRVMDILALGSFPAQGVPLRFPEPDEERWDNEGGRYHAP
jgi:hypothetical protein